MAYQSFVLAVAFCLLLAAGINAEVEPTEKGYEVTTKLVCEHDILSISCPPGSVIQIALGFYGRQSLPHSGPWYCGQVDRSKMYSCSTSQAKEIIKNKCNKRQSCSFQSSNSVFGDPCPGIPKYTTVGYFCYAREVQTKHACEHETLSISCPRGYVIQVIKGFYGRNSDKYCARGPRSAYNCSSSRAQGIIASKCNNKQSCSVESSNSVFGDPCVGTFKYTTVEYHCDLVGF